jgi:hypothetical protein
VLGVDYAVDDRISKVDVGRCHVDLGPKHARPVGKLTRTHAREQVEVLLGGSSSEGAVLAGLGQSATVLSDLLGGMVIDIGLPC